MTFKEIEEIKTYVCENIEGKISTSDVARKYLVSRSGLYNEFKRMTGITLGQFIRDKKFERAREYLESGKPCQWVADRMGYSCYQTFLCAYKSYYGEIPSVHKAIAARRRKEVWLTPKMKSCPDDEYSLYSLYVEYRDGVPVAYRYGEPWVIQQLLMEGGYDTPEEAKAKWFEYLKEREG